MTNSKYFFSLNHWKKISKLVSNINFHEAGPYNIETSPLICSVNKLDWFLYNRDLPHERVKYKLLSFFRIELQKLFNTFIYVWLFFTLCMEGWTHYGPVLLIYTTENIRKPKCFLMFSGGIDQQHWAVMGELSWETDTLLFYYFWL